MEMMQANQHGNLITSSSLVRCSGKQFSKKEASNIIFNADLRVGEIRQFCRLQKRSRVWCEWR